MPIIKCAAVDCLHNNGSGNCTEIHQIDIDSAGRCLDYSPVSAEEKSLILGKPEKHQRPAE